jgi:putative acetyltransferase
VSSDGPVFEEYSYSVPAGAVDNPDHAMTPTVRPETTADHEAVRRVHRRAFGRDDEAALVDALRAGGFARVSLVAEFDGAVVGHVLFGDLPILTDGGSVSALFLAPLAVLPEHQKRGIGSELVRAGLAACRDAGHRIVVVLGHADYYPRFGFSAKLAEPLASPFSGRNSWMAAELAPGALEGVSGWVQYPRPFGVGPSARPNRLRLLVVDGSFAVCKLPCEAPPPAWATGGKLFSVTRTADELSVVCDEELVPDGVVCERGWRCLRVAGAMPFTLIGVLARLTTPLANAGIGVFALSTFDTDYLLVKAGEFEKAVAALRADGHTVGAGTDGS